LGNEQTSMPVAHEVPPWGSKPTSTSVHADNGPWYPHMCRCYGRASGNPRRINRSSLKAWTRTRPFSGDDNGSPTAYDVVRRRSTIMYSWTR
jgi:hypothetical protein